jgi:HD-GYP domain-containing protein (c-di-GMP phosphodiesterase class II)
MKGAFRAENENRSAQRRNGPLKTYPLRIFVNRVLLIRLAVTTIGIALIAGMATFFVQQNRLEQQVADIGRQGIRAVIRRVLEIVEQQQIKHIVALHMALETVAEIPDSYRSGRFILVQFYDRVGTVFAEASVPGPQTVDAKALTEKLPLTFPETRQVEAETQYIGGQQFVFAVMPITDQQGDVEGYSRGVFAVSNETSAEMRGAVLLSWLIVVAIVFLVTAILYPVILRLTRRLADYSTKLLDANLETLVVLGNAIAKRDTNTDAHNYRVSLYAAHLGAKIGLGIEDMRGLIKGSLIHDVGKIGIPDAILLKPGRLDDEEYRVMQTHVDLGVDIVGRSSCLRDSVPVVAAHHEKFGGGGYPKDARAQEIPLVARIFAIADVFDALTSTRPYKKPLEFADSMKILYQGRGSHFDPALLDAFAGIGRELYDNYAGHEGNDLRQILVAVVDKYFSAGMDSLIYGRDNAASPSIA